MRRSKRELLSAVMVGMGVGSLCAACVVSEDDGSAYGDLTFLYDFQGLDCQEAGVDSVDFYLDGDRGGTASASTECAPRYFTFVDLLEDDYWATIDGYDSGNGLLYSGTFRVEVFGNSGHEVSVSLPPAAGGLTFYWTFAGSAACFDVVDVHVLLYDPFAAVYDDAFYPCQQGGVVYDDVMAGGWRVWLDALDSHDFVLYSAHNIPLYVDAGEANVYEIDLTF